MTKLTATLAAGALLVGAAAQAQQQDYGPFPYNYAYANYAMTDASSGGFELGGSVEVMDRVHAFASWKDWELGNNFDRRTWQIGAGYRWGLAPNADVIAHVAYANSRLSRPGPPPTISNSGAILGGTIRGWITRNTELSGSLLLDRSLRNGTDAVLEFGGQYFINDTFSIGGRLRLDDDDSTVFLGGRYYFGDLIRGNR
jgi:hypothetical protein